MVQISKLKYLGYPVSCGVMISTQGMMQLYVQHILWDAWQGIHNMMQSCTTKRGPVYVSHQDHMEYWITVIPAFLEWTQWWAWHRQQQGHERIYARSASWAQRHDIVTFAVLHNLLWSHDEELTHQMWYGSVTCLWYDVVTVISALMCYVVPIPFIITRHGILSGRCATSGWHEGIGVSYQQQWWYHISLPTGAAAYRCGCLSEVVSEPNSEIIFSLYVCSSCD